MSQHHGKGDDPVTRLKKLLTVAVEEEGLGATGEFPLGNLDVADEGELVFGIAILEEKIIFNFGKEVSWIGFDAEFAMNLAAALVGKVGDIKGVKLSMRVQGE